MMWDEKQLREALREEINGPAPSVTTELSDIMPRGLRRRRFRQAGSVAAAAAVVAGIGVAAMTLGGQSSSLNEPADQSTVTTTMSAPVDAPWSTAPFAPRKPYGTYSPAFTAPLPPSWPRMQVPLCSVDDVSSRMNRSGIDVPQPFRDKLMASLREVAAPADVGDLRFESVFSDVFEYTVDIADRAGAGSLQVLAKKSVGDPKRSADETAFAEQNCAPPKRVGRPDGTLLQLYPVTASEPFQSLGQRVIIFRPDGMQYTLTVRNWSSKDVQEKGSHSDRTGMGRPTLPLTEYQMSMLAERLAGG